MRQIRVRSSLGSPLLAVEQFQLAELEQKAKMIDVVGGTAGGDLLALGEHGGQLEGLEVMLEEYQALGLGLLHDAPPASVP
jgi:hypothetical protein